MYASLGLFGVIFIAHGFCIYDFAVQRRRLSLEWMLVMGALNLVGAVFYALRVSLLERSYARETHADGVEVP